MKATLLLGAIFLMSLVMADEQDESSPKGQDKATPQNGTVVLQSTGIMLSESPVFILLPLMWMMVHLLHM